MDLISKPFYMTTLIGSLVVFVAAFVGAMFFAASGEAGANFAMVLVLAGFASLLMGFVIWLTLIHRLWSTIEQGNVRTTPGKAVGFLFIPFFNLYWIFIAHWGLARDWNRIMASYPDLARAPRISAGVGILLKRTSLTRTRTCSPLSRKSWLPSKSHRQTPPLESSEM